MQIRRPSPIPIIALDIHVNDNHFNLYDRMSPEVKIALIASRITAICELFKKQNYHGPLIIGWRENGITGEQDERAISKKVLKKFKMAMELLVESYPNLQIYAGAMAVFKHKNKSHLKPLLREYQTNRTLAQVRKIELHQPGTIQVDLHQSEANKLSREPLSRGFYKLQVSSYIFSTSKKMRHDKIAPWQETQETNYTPSVFQPPRKPNALCKMQYQRVKINVRIVICREFNIIKKMDDSIKSDLTILMSDSIRPDFEGIDTHCAVQFDSTYRSRLVLVNDENTEENTTQFELYTTNMLEEEPNLAGPFQPISNFACKMLSKLDEMLYVFSQFEHTKHLLMEIYNQVVGLVYSEIPQDICSLSREIFNQFEQELLNSISIVKQGLFQTLPGHVLQECKKQMKNDIENIRSWIDEEANRLIKKNRADAKIF